MYKIQKKPANAGLKYIIDETAKFSAHFRPEALSDL